MNRGELGTSALNHEIQELLNPRKDGMPELVRGDLRLRPGDKVIQNVNNYELGVFNGDIGIVQYCMVDGGKTIVKFGERVVNYTLEDCLELRLAYAITIHKSQGSEFPVVIIPCSMQHYVMLQRNLIYTALTRAKKLAVFVGTRKALLHAVNNQSSKLRQSMLDQRLRGQN
jgi:exodeoxyribonuclease V alpha subunit